MLPAASAPPRFSSLVLLTAVAILSLNMILPSLANIAADLGTSYALASLAISGFLAVNALMQLILGPMADRYGRRPVLLWAMAIYALASIVCALAPSITILLIARTIQAVVVTGTVLASAIVSDTEEPEAAASKLGYLAMYMAVAPMLAPLVGGVLDEMLGWRYSFWLYSVLGAAMLWLVWTDVGETNPAPADTIWKQMRSYSELFTARRFWGYTLCMGFGVGAFYLFIAGAALVGQESFMLRTAIVGLGIGTITGGFFLGSFLAGRFSQAVGPLRMLVVGRLVGVIGIALALLAFTIGLGHPLTFFGGAITAGISNGLCTPSAKAGAMAVRPKIAGSASGLSGAVTVGVGAVVTPLPGLFLTPQNGPWLTLAMMLVLSLGGLAAALDVRRQEALRSGP